MAVVFDSTGTVSDVAGDVNLAPTAPATVNSGDLLICQIAHQNNATQLSATYTPPSGWTLVHSATQNSTRLLIYNKDTVDGTEDGATFTWTVGSGLSTVGHNAAIHRFTGNDGGLISHSSGSGNSAIIADSDVVVANNGSLAVNFICHDSGSPADHIVSDATWTDRFSYFTSRPTIFLVDHATPTAATIGGSTWTTVGSTTGPWICHGYEIKEAAAAGGSPIHVLGQATFSGDSVSFCL